MMLNKLNFQIEKNMKQFSDKKAIELDNNAISYGELEHNIRAWSEEFKKIGIIKNSKVIICTDQYIEFIEILIAVWREQCIPIPVESKVSTFELEKAMKESDTQFIIMDRLEDDFIQSTVTFEKSKYNPTFTYVKRESEEDSQVEDLSNKAFFFYTSGTTGNPKCVVFENEAMFYNIVDLVEEASIREKDIFFTPLSPILTATLTTAVIPTLYAGGTLILTT